MNVFTYLRGRSTVTRSCFVMVLSYCLFGCLEKVELSDEAKVESNRTIVAGKIENYEKYSNTRFVNLSTPSGNHRDEFYESKIAEDGTFKIEFIQYYSEEFGLSPFENIFVHPEPGDSIFISINLDEAGQLAFSGDGSEKQTKLNVFHNKGYFSESRVSSSVYAAHSPESFLEYSDSIRQFDLASLAKFVREKQPSPELAESLRARVLNEEYKRLLSYGTCSCRDQPELKQANVRYFSRISERLRADAPKLAKHSSFKEVANLYTYYQYKANESGTDRLIEGGFKAEAEDFRFIMENAGSPDLERHLAYNFGKMILFRHKLSDFEAFRQELPDYLKEGELMSDLNDRYLGKVTEEKLEANAAYGLEKMKDTEHGKLLEEIIANNKGKVIYLDVWAPFCAPCIVDMRDSQEIIAKEFSGKEVAFVYLCMGEENECRKIINDNQVGGVHLTATPGQSEGLLPAFNQNGYPFQLIINRRGEIVRAGSVYRMMEPATRKLLDRMLADA